MVSIGHQTLGITHLLSKLGHFEGKRTMGVKRICISALCLFKLFLGKPGALLASVGVQWQPGNLVALPSLSDRSHQAAGSQQLCLCLPGSTPSSLPFRPEGGDGFLWCPLSPIHVLLNSLFNFLPFQLEWPICFLPAPNCTTLQINSVQEKFEKEKCSEHINTARSLLRAVAQMVPWFLPKSVCPDKSPQ